MYGYKGRTFIVSCCICCTASLDYQAGSGRVTVSSVATVATHSVSILSDDVTEGSEFFGLILSDSMVQLSDGTNVALSADEAARVVLDPTAANVEILDLNGKYVAHSDKYNYVVHALLKNVWLV